MATVRGDYEAARQAASDWVSLVPELGLPGDGAYRALGEALSGLERHEEAVEYLSEALRRNETRGASSAFVGETRQVLARAYLGAGRLTEAKGSAELAYREIADEDAFSRSTTGVALAMVRAAEGEATEADRLFRLAIEAARDYRNLAVEARISYARFLIEQGRASDARAQLRVAGEFFAHPFVAKRRAQVEALIRRCNEVRA
ncbi:MAG: hypothetical protein WEE03_08830 [Chloroflexota bacterium]